MTMPTHFTPRVARALASAAAQAARDARHALDAARRRLAGNPQAATDYWRAAAEFHAASRIARDAVRAARESEGGTQ